MVARQIRQPLLDSLLNFLLKNHLRLSQSTHNLELLLHHLALELINSVLSPLLLSLQLLILTLIDHSLQVLPLVHKNRIDVGLHRTLLQVHVKLHNDFLHLLEVVRMIKHLFLKHFTRWHNFIIQALVVLVKCESLNLIHDFSYRLLV